MQGGDIFGTQPVFLLKKHEICHSFLMQHNTVLKSVSLQIQWTVCAVITWWHASTQSEYDIVWCILKGYVKDDLWRTVKIMWEILLVIKI